MVSWKQKAVIWLLLLILKIYVKDWRHELRFEIQAVVWQRFGYTIRDKYSGGRIWRACRKPESWQCPCSENGWWRGRAGYLSGIEHRNLFWRRSPGVLHDGQKEVPGRGVPFGRIVLERTHPSGAVFGALHFRSFRCIRYGLRRSGLTEKYSFRSERQAFRVWCHQILLWADGTGA